MTIRVDRRPGRSDVAVRGELDLATAPELNAVLSEAAAPEVVLDLSGLSFVDSSGLAVLVAHRRAARARGAQLRVVRPGGCVLRTFELAGLRDVLAL